MCGLSFLGGRGVLGGTDYVRKERGGLGVIFVFFSVSVMLGSVVFLSIHMFLVCGFYYCNVMKQSCLEAWLL